MDYLHAVYMHAQSTIIPQLGTYHVKYKSFLSIYYDLLCLIA